MVSLGGSLQQKRLPAPGVDQGPLNRAITTLIEDSAALAINPPALSLAVDTAFHAFATDAARPRRSSLRCCSSPPRR